MATTSEFIVPIPLYMLAQGEDYDEKSDVLSITDLARQLVFHSEDALVMVFFSSWERANTFAKGNSLRGKIVRCDEARLLKVLMGYQPQWFTVDPSVNDPEPRIHPTRGFVEKIAKRQGFKINFVE
jgi:hypothetical protein